MADFPPSFLQDKDGNAILFQEQEAYDAALEAGWKDTPAAFGIETHPANPSTSVLAPAAPAAPAAALDLTAFYALLGSIQATQANDAALIGELSARVALLEAALETPSAPAPPDPDQAAMAAGRRRS